MDFIVVLPDYTSHLYQPLLPDLIMLVLHARIPDTVTGQFHQPLPVVAVIPGRAVPLTHAVKPAVPVSAVGLTGIFAWTKAEVMTLLSLRPKTSLRRRLAWRPLIPLPLLCTTLRLAQPKAGERVAVYAMLNVITGATPLR